MTGSLALGYLVPAGGYVIVAFYAFYIPRLSRVVDVHDVEVATIL